MANAEVSDVINVFSTKKHNDLGVICFTILAKMQNNENDVKVSSNNDYNNNNSNNNKQQNNKLKIVVLVGTSPMLNVFDPR